MRERVKNQWEVGEWTFYEIVDHGFAHDDLGDKPLYKFAVTTVAPGEKPPKPNHELYKSLDHAMAAAIAEKWTGQRGAGGTGVGTAADWFMRMIGADS